MEKLIKEIRAHLANRNTRFDKTDTEHAMEKLVSVVEQLVAKSKEKTK